VPCLVQDWGRIDYLAAVERLRSAVQDRIHNRSPDRLIFCEHDWTITLGRKPGASGSVLDAGDIPVFESERGGDATLHGPGQLVVYPVFALREGERDLHRYLRNLEEVVIQSLRSFGLSTDRNGPTGVWFAGKKIANLGITARRWVVSHGLSLNLDLDLSRYYRIRPCGLDPSIMTSLEAALGKSPSRDEVIAAFLAEAGPILGRDFSPAASD
jgi:lipoate-protein ligase B